MFHVDSVRKCVKAVFLLYSLQTRCRDFGLSLFRTQCREKIGAERRESDSGAVRFGLAGVRCLARRVEVNAFHSFPALEMPTSIDNASAFVRESET